MSLDRNRLTPTANWRVAILLWKASRQRARGRTRRQKELWQNKTTTPTNAIAALGSIVMFLFALFVHLIMGSLVLDNIAAARQIAEEASHNVLVVQADSQRAVERLNNAEDLVEGAVTEADRRKSGIVLESAVEKLSDELSRERSRVFGGDSIDYRQDIQNHVLARGSDGFVVKDMDDTLLNPADLPGAYWLYAGFILIWWLAILIFQGEGLDMDIQKRRHPHWEWLFSHPVNPVAAFSAEFLAPMMANYIYVTAPVFWFVIFNSIWSTGIAVVMGLAVGLAFAVSAACLNKAIEIAAMLRLPVRRRGLFLGLGSFLGFAAMFAPLVFMSNNSLSIALLHLGFSLQEIAPLGFFFQRFFAGSGEAADAWHTLLASGALALLLLVTAILTAWWATRKGLQATESAVSVEPAGSGKPSSGWTRNAYYRKEMLWLRRDKAAVVQMLLIPLCIVGFQALNLRSLTQKAFEQWYTLCSLGILCGTYFLIVAGPRSLTSEGTSLWIAQTWPRSLDSLLKAKARMWFGFSTLVVYAILSFALFTFPEHGWRIALVGIGWALFGWGLALKSVCLVTVASSSGEQERPTDGRKWMLWFGTLAFAGGVMTQSWHAATIGIVFSLVTAAAMWQNLRARLPYLFDPWSEQLPKPPTLMHSMMGIAIMVEIVSIVIAISTSTENPQGLWLTRAIVYAVVGGAAWLSMQNFLNVRGVTARDVWRWNAEKSRWNLPMTLLCAMISGVILAGVGHLYLDVLRSLSVSADYMAQLDELNERFSGGIAWQLVLAVGVAPPVEEYFFRGLLFRSLDREIGGWRAMLGSSAFFAIYHPPVSWLPVFLLGIVSAFLFKRGGRLLPCVVLHMVYNLIVVTVVN